MDYDETVKGKPTGWEFLFPFVFLALVVVCFWAGGVAAEGSIRESVNKELIEKGYKRHNPQTGKIEWTEQKYNSNQKE